MGQIFSGPYHRAELQMRKSNQILDYQPQPAEEIMQLDTEVDQRGNTTVDHVFKMTREVYGQRARDLKLRTVEWRDYGIELKKRPSPYDFPAFEHEERINETRHTTTNTQDGSLMKQPTNASEKAKPLQANSKQPIDSKEPAKNASAESKNDNKKAAPAASQQPRDTASKKQKRISHNVDLDKCSLEDEG